MKLRFAPAISIRQLLLWGQIAGILSLATGLLIATTLGASRAVRNLSGSMIERTVEHTTSELHRFFDPISRGLQAARQWGESGFLDAGLFDPARVELLSRIFAPYLEQQPETAEIALADADGHEFRLSYHDRVWLVTLTRQGHRGPESRQLLWDRQSLSEVTDWVDTDTDPRAQPWFQAAAARSGGADGAIVWTDPYRVPSQGRGLQLTAATAYPRPGGVSVLAFDILLEDLQDYLDAIRVSELGAISLMTADARFVALPNDQRFWAGMDALGWQLATPAELQMPLIEDAVRSFGARPSEARGTPLRFQSGGEAWWAQIRSVEVSRGLTLLVAVLVPNSDLLAERQDIRRRILMVSVAVLALAIFGAARLARMLSRPIEALVRHTERIGRGDLAAPKRAISSSLSEVRHLAAAHDRMRLGLRSLLDIERDLQIARQIQEGALPATLPELADFEIACWSEAASVTGGDVYDVIALDANGTPVDGSSGPESPPSRVLLLLADATGHGIGAAISVVQIRSMVRMALRSNPGLDVLAWRLNAQLLADLPSNRFITAWLGELDTQSGKLTGYSAGQAPLLLFDSSEDEVVSLAADAPPFGLFAQPALVRPSVWQLDPGDLVAVLSDGIFETQRVEAKRVGVQRVEERREEVEVSETEGEELGVDRVSEILLAQRDQSASVVLDAIREQVETFTGGHPAADDRTIVILRRKQSRQIETD